MTKDDATLKAGLLKTFQKNVCNNNMSSFTFYLIDCIQNFISKQFSIGCYSLVTGYKRTVAITG